MAKRDKIALAVALAATALVGSEAFANGFVWDDQQVIVDGTVIHDPTELGRALASRTMLLSAGAPATDDRVALDSYRPITVATFFLDSALSGREPWAYHLTNLLGHLACVALVLLLARKLVPNAGSVVPALAAAWFGLTPELAEAHVWIDGRSDVFCALFGLAALAVWIDALPRSGRGALFRQGLAGGLFLLGLGSKETLVFALPAFVLVPLPAEEPTIPWRRRVGASWGLLCATAAYLAFRASVLGGMKAGNGVLQAATAAIRYPAVVLDATSEVLIPTRVYVRSLVDDYDSLGKLGLGACALGFVLLAVAAIRARRRAPLLAWAWFAFACTLAPAALISTVMWPGFGRYLYLPSALLALGIADAVARALAHPRIASHPRAPRLLVVALGTWVGALGLALALYVPAFHDEESLWRSVIDAAPDHAHGWGYLGITMLEKGEPEGALPLLERAEEIDPGEPRYLLQLGWARYLTGRTQGSLDACATGLHRFPPGGDFHALAARNLATMRPDLARRHLETCLTVEPNNPECLRARADLGGS